MITINFTKMNRITRSNGQVKSEKTDKTIYLQ